jgi:hypothetical protein
MNMLSRSLISLVLVLWMVPGSFAQTPPSKPVATKTVPKATPSASSPTPTVTPSKSVVSTKKYDYKLRELEEKIVGLKERIFKTKTRLLLLKERILNDVIAEAKAVIVHSNEMGPSFRLKRLVYHLDGEKIYYQDSTTSKLVSKKSFEIYSANVLPGDHVLSVDMTYRGDSSVFTYLKDYVFKLRANFTFFATKGKITRLEAVGYKKGDITWELTKRPSITFRVRQTNYTKAASEGKTKMKTTKKNAKTKERKP